jgi:succinoglycan biosynthesis transport protein ExoP
MLLILWIESDSACDQIMKLVTRLDNCARERSAFAAEVSSRDAGRGNKDFAGRLLTEADSASDLEARQNQYTSSEPKADGASVGGAEERFKRSPEEATVGSAPVQQLMSVLRRRIALVVTIAVTGTLFIGALAFLLPPKYTAIAQLLVGPPQADPLASPGAASAAPDGSAIETQVAMLNSREHLERVAASFAQQVGRGERDGQGASSPASDGNLGASEVVGELTLEDLERHLRVAQERSSHVISVSFTSTNPKRAAIVANRAVQLYVETQGEEKRALLAMELRRLEGRIAALKKDMDQTSTEIQKMLQQRVAGQRPEEARDAEIRLRELEREAGSRTELYTNLLQRQREVRYQEETVTSDVRVLALASVPKRSSSPGPLLFVIPAFIIFSMCGCWVAFFVDRLDEGLRGQKDVIEALGISCIGMVSQLSRLGKLRPDRYLRKYPYGAYTEAIRSIATSLRLSLPGNGTRIILATSSLPKEGKTTLAVSLAVYAALLRRRVVLLDLDFRRPAVMRMLRGKAPKGVADLLIHDLPLEDIVRRVPGIGLDYLPMRNCSVDPVSLFSGTQLSDLLDRLRRDYECVIIDGPPLLGVTEARLLAGLADKVLLVVKWGSTRKEVARNAVKLLQEAGCFDGAGARDPVAVLTQVNLKEHARYRYGDAGEHLSNYTNYYPGSLTNYSYSALPAPASATSVEAEPPSSHEIPGDDRNG